MTGAENCVVSVVVPMLNGEAFIEEALHSILRERTVAIEAIVVDDGSTDRSRALVAALGDPRVRIVDGPRRGIAACLNVGIEASRGEIIMRCDADDMYTEGRILRQVSWLTDHPLQDAVAGAFSTIDPSGRLVAKVGKRNMPHFEQIEGELQRGVTRTHLCTFAIRRRVFDRVGLFREYFETAEDRDFQLRMGEQCRVGYQPLDAYLYRLHGASITHSRSNERRAFFDNIAVQFQKERLSGGADAIMRNTAPTPPAHDADRPATSATLHVHGMLIGQSWRDIGEGQALRGLRRAGRALMTHPFYLRGWVNFAKVLSRVVFPK